MRGISAKPELHAQLCGDGGKALSEQVRVACLVAGQAQAADEARLHPRQRRLGHDAAGRVEHIVRHAVLVQHRGVVVDMVKLLGGAEQLQRTALAVVVGNPVSARRSRRALRLYSASRTIRPLLRP